MYVPGKAFIAGEYIAVKGGPCLVMATAPKFKMSVRNQEVPFFAHLDSPAGKYAQKFPELFKYDFSFQDAYDGRGGFGASTAQFIMLYAWHLSLQKRSVQTDELMKAYRECAYSGVGLEPSGADLLTQWQGSFCFVEKNKSRVEKTEFPFSDVDLILFSTGVKVPTHEHLAKLGSFDSSELENAFLNVQSAWKEGQSQEFAQGINDFRKALKSLNFEAESTTKIIERIESQFKLLAAKGCGALGSDVILLVVNSKDSASVQHWLGAEGFKFIMTQRQVSSGLEL